MSSSPQPSPPPRTRNPSLARELLWNLVLLTTAALSLAAATALTAEALRPRFAVAAIVFLIAADVIVFVVFGRYLIGRLVVTPLARLMDAADALAAGDLARRAPDAETAEFSLLAERFNQMTEALLDAQSQLVRAEKLAGIGGLAAGIAHEIGNPLAAIENYVGVLRQRGADPEILGAIARETDRIDRIVRSLLSYARPSDDPVGPVLLTDVVGGAVELLRQQGALNGCAVDLALDASAPPARGRRHELEQVAVNLLLNAADAAPDGPIAVTVQATTFEPRGSEARPRRGESPDAVPPRRPVLRRPLRPDLPAGAPGVLFVVADAGTGVPVAERERIFDPFYTTKDPGRGTGLGLAIVQRTVHEAGGIVWVDDARHGGAAFKIFLPTAEVR